AAGGSPRYPAPSNDSHPKRCPTPMPNTLFQEIRQLLALALPLALAQLAQTSMGFIDTLMVGRLGNQGLASIALGNTFFFFLLTLATGVLLAVGPLVSQAHGSGDQTAMGRAVRQGMWLATGLTLLALPVFLNAGRLFVWLGQEPETAGLAARYVQAIAWGFLPSLWFTCSRGLLEGLANPRPILLITLCGVLLNIVGDLVLMFGYLHVPALGLVGTGYASAAVFWLMFALGVLYVRRHYRPYGIYATLRRPDPAALRELLAIGLPIGLTLGFETGMFTTTALLMGLLGSLPLAAHQIAIQTATLTFMVTVGVAIATSVRVGQAAGRRDAAALRLSGFTGIGLGATFMMLTALAFWLLPERIVSIYIDVRDPANAEVARLAAGFLMLAAGFQVFDGLQAVAAGALRGLKDTRAPMLISLASYWGIGIGSGVLLAFGRGMGGRGLWLGLTFGLATAGLLLTVRFALSVRRFRARMVYNADQTPADGCGGEYGSRVRNIHE
ncbi:MAG TPA: MATE family efflux transporter, partial [Trueperaceae bacterium]